MFIRDINPATGEPFYYDVMGLWGSGNTVGERELRPTNQHTAYTLWSGKGIWGPRAGQFLRQYTAESSLSTLGEFIDRFGGDATVDCQYFTGREEGLGQGCEAACDHVGPLCPVQDRLWCLVLCYQMDAAGVQCLGELTECSAQSCRVLD